MSDDTATVAKNAALARIQVSEPELAAMVPELNASHCGDPQPGERAGVRGQRTTVAPPRRVPGRVGTPISARLS